MRLAVIRNPKSGRGSGADRWRKVEDLLRLHFPNVHIESTTTPGSAREQARRLAGDGFDIIAAAGGDGTLSSVMEGLLGTDATLAVLPFGTGNDFSRTLGFGTDTLAAANAIVAGKTIRVDVGRWQQGERTGHFLNVAGCGFDAEVAQRVNTGFRYLRGQSAYVAAILQSLVSYKPRDLTLRIDGEELRVSAMLVAIANAKSYGGGMLVAPTAEISDGFLDLVIVENISKLEFLRCFPSVFKGAHLSHPRVMHRRFRKLEIIPKCEINYLADGEALTSGNLSVEVSPSRIQVIAS